jgi:hypothetical protein
MIPAMKEEEKSIKSIRTKHYPTINHGQIMYFCRIDFEHEPLLKNVPFANIAYRPTESDNSYRHTHHNLHWISNHKEVNTRFTATTNIDSTKYVTVAFDAEGNPISKDASIWSEKNYLNYT